MSDATLMDIDNRLQAHIQAAVDVHGCALRHLLEFRLMTALVKPAPEWNAGEERCHDPDHCRLKQETNEHGFALIGRDLQRHRRYNFHRIDRVG